MSEKDLALNNLQWLICHKTQPNQIPLGLNIVLSARLRIYWLYPLQVGKTVTKMCILGISTACMFVYELHIFINCTTIKTLTLLMWMSHIQFDANFLFISSPETIDSCKQRSTLQEMLDENGSYQHEAKYKTKKNFLKRNIQVFQRGNKTFGLPPFHK